MQKMFGFIIHYFFLSVASASFFMASNIVSPLKAVVSHSESHIPRMSIRFEEFSPAFAALEDDYYIAEYEDEKIPVNVAARELKAGTFEIVPNPDTHFELPSMSMNPGQVFEQEAVSYQASRNAPQRTAASQLVAQQQQQKNYQSGLNLPHHWVQGKFELTGGLAIISARDSVHVGWFVEGRKVRDGKVRIQDGSYEIKVDRLEGELIAELVDPNGYLRGEAIVDLEDLAKKKDTSQIVISGIDMRLAPYAFGSKGQTVSIYHTPKSPSPVPNTQVAFGRHDLRANADEKGQWKQETVSNKSTALLFANNGQHREALILADLERSQTIRLFPERFMTALFDTIELDKKFRDLGVIWGTVRFDDVPAGGYKVRIGGHHEVPTVYFTTYIADDSRQNTSADGQYVFVGMLDGEYEIEVLNSKDQVVDSKLVAVRSGAVSLSDFEVGAKDTLHLRTFDPFSEDPQEVELYALGGNSVLKTQTEDILKLPVTRGTEPLLVYLKPKLGSIEGATFASRSRKYQEIPILNEAWWARMQKERGIKVSSGVIVGFLDTDQPFEAFFEDPLEGTKILYFNHSGQIITDGSQKPSGFIIYGTGSGIKTIIIESATGLLTTEAAYVDGESIALIYKTL